MTLQQNHFVLAKGTEVEVTSEEDGFRGAWFRATILETPPKPSSRKRKQVLVQYKDLVAEKSVVLKEYADPIHIRPLPPESEVRERVFEENDVVDAAHRDGWWTGVVRKVMEGGRYRVYFDNPTDVIEFSGDELRPHWEWIDGNWVRSPMLPTAKSIYGSGESVEVQIECKGISAWFPALVVKEYGDNTFLVKYQSTKNGDENGTMKTIVDSGHIRPPPPCFEDRDYELLETVDMRHESGWRQGVVTKVLAERTYRIFLNQGNEVKDAVHAEIRPHVDWADSKWVSKSEKALIVSNIQEQFRVGIANKMGTSKDSSDGKTPSSVGIRKLIVKSSSSDERLAGGNSAPGPLSTVEPSIESKHDYSHGQFRRVRYNKKSAGVVPSPYLPGSLASGKRFRIKEHIFLDKSGEKLETIPKKRKHTISPTESLQALVADKDEKAVDVADQDINDNENVPKEVELSLILGLEAKKMKHARHSYSFKLSSERTPKPSQNGQNSLDELAGDTSEKISQLAVGGSQKRKRGRPRKLILSSENSEAGKGENVTAEVINDLVAEDQIPHVVELPVQTATELSASNGVARETNCVTKEVDMAIVGLSRDVTDDDNRPLSMWFGGIPSSKNGLPSGKSANGWSDAKERQIDLLFEGDVVLHEKKQLPFTKNSAVWKTIESMEVFQVVPQNPHFAPLAECKEEYREGMAVGFMVTFSGMFDKIASLQFDSTRSKFEGVLEGLLELEKHGFDITLPRRRVNEMLSIKDAHEELLSKSQSAELEITEQSDEKRELLEKINAIEKKITKLQEEVAACKSKMKSKDFQISSLRSSADAMNKIIDKARNDFEKVATAGWNLPG